MLFIGIWRLTPAPTRIQCLVGSSLLKTLSRERDDEDCLEPVYEKCLQTNQCFSCH